jgi:Big-like domain-containing protein
MTRRSAVLPAFILAASLILIAPSIGNGVDDALRLHLGTDGLYFKYGTTTQPLTVAKSGCQITSAEPLVDLSSNGTTSPGLSGTSMGVKSTGSNANGTPCGQVDSTETLSLAPVTSPSTAALAGRTFNKVRLDVEMTANAVVKVRFYNGSTLASQATLQTGTSIVAAQTQEGGYDMSAPYEVTTDTSDDLPGAPVDLVDACAAPNSSGPNNAGNDNCLWTIDPGLAFTRVELTTTLGNVALEGSGDFANDTSHDTLLYVANGAPVATADSYSTNEDTQLVVAAPGVLSNDSDVNNDGLTAVLVSGPSHAATNGFTLNSNGSFSYTPFLNFHGPDSFTYKANDGAIDSNTTTVSITVNAVNDPPVATGSSPSTAEDTAVTIPVGSDPADGDTNLTTDCTADVAGGSIHDNGDGSVTYTPPLNFNGTVHLTCTVTDSGGAQSTTSATVNVGVTPVNDPPVANDDTAETDENVAVTVQVRANDTDVDGDTLSITTASPAASHGTVSCSTTSCTYTPAADYFGADSFAYAISDGHGGTDTATVNVTVFQVICTSDSVDFSSPQDIVNGTITKITGTDPVVCKRYTLVASDPSNADGGTLLLDPSSASNIQVKYRAYVQFAPDPAPAITSSTNSFVGRLEYDPTGGTTLQPMQWCIDPQFNGDGDVTDATLPGTETWCIASTSTHGVADGKVLTRWQVFGIDDPYIVKKS